MSLGAGFHCNRSQPTFVWKEGACSWPACWPHSLSGLHRLPWLWEGCGETSAFSLQNRAKQPKGSHGQLRACSVQLLQAAFQSVGSLLRQQLWTKTVPGFKYLKPLMWYIITLYLVHNKCHSLLIWLLVLLCQFLECFGALKFITDMATVTFGLINFSIMSQLEWEAIRY